MKKTKSNFDNKIFKKLFINMPRELLHKKIDKRVERMFAEGVVAEVINFLKMQVNKELSSNKIIGIKEIKDYIDGKIISQDFICPLAHVNCLLAYCLVFSLISSLVLVKVIFPSI